ncbi:hypothetical protein C5C31_14995, partial [Rathayibacter rathayi]|uniref:EndoU domain-containing protein n=1 Tax=Rathayibacter rathayi TaxID=33887 RepID=UPI000D3F4686
GGALAGAAMGAGGPLLGHGLTGAGRAGKNLLGKEADALTPDITTPSEPLNAVKPVPEKYINLASPSRTRHILDGDGTSTGKAGGHRWTDSPDRDPNKTMFPAEWFDAKIMHEVSDVATDPSLRWKQNKGPLGSDYAKNGEPSRILVEGLRDGVTIRVIVEPIGEGIITAFPIN